MPGPGCIAGRSGVDVLIQSLDAGLAAQVSGDAQLHSDLEPRTPSPGPSRSILNWWRWRRLRHGVRSECDYRLWELLYGTTQQLQWYCGKRMHRTAAALGSNPVAHSGAEDVAVPDVGRLGGDLRLGVPQA